MITFPTDTSALASMVREAIQSHRLDWLATFPDATDDDLTKVNVSWETYTRCIAFTLGAVYPDSTYDRAGMHEWSRDLQDVRTVLGAVVRDRYSIHRAVPIALNALRELATDRAA